MSRPLTYVIAIFTIGLGVLGGIALSYIVEDETTEGGMVVTLLIWGIAALSVGWAVQSSLARRQSDEKAATEGMDLRRFKKTEEALLQMFIICFAPRPDVYIVPDARRFYPWKEALLRLNRGYGGVWRALQMGNVPILPQGEGVAPPKLTNQQQCSLKLYASQVGSQPVR